MNFHKVDQYLDKILSHVKYIFDHNKIEVELKNHILDKVDYLVEKGHKLAEAESIAISEMGDAEEIGKELNKQHNPIIGYIFSASKVLIVLLILVNIFSLFSVLQSTFFTKDNYKIDQKDIMYKVDINKEVIVDDLVINFNELVYENNNKLNVHFNQYTKNSLAQANNITGFEIRDNHETLYLDYTVSTKGGIIRKSLLTIDDFPQDVDFITLNYDHFNRSFTVKIPIEAGDKNE